MFSVSKETVYFSGFKTGNSVFKVASEGYIGLIGFWDNSKISARCCNCIMSSLRNNGREK